jgi:hypothetical protein
MKNKLYYLACPYTHPDRKIMDARLEEVTRIAVELLKQGIYVFSPISYNGPWEKYNLPHEFSFWEDFDKTFITKCDGIFVLRLEGWDKSIGVKAEIEFAHQIDIPVYHITPNDVDSGILKSILESICPT